MARIRNQCAAICVWRLKKTHAICAIYSLQLHCGQPQQQERQRICCQRNDDDCDCCSSEGPTPNSFHTAQHQQSATTTERPTAAAQWCISYAIYAVIIPQQSVFYFWPGDYNSRYYRRFSMLYLILNLFLNLIGTAFL